MADTTLPNPMLAEGWHSHAAWHDHAAANRTDGPGVIRGVIRDVIGRSAHSPSEERT